MKTSKPAESEIIETYISFIGGTKHVMRLWPASDSHGWVSWLRRIVVILALPIMWTVSATFYVVMFASVIGIVLWLFITQARRHAIHREALLLAAQQRPEPA